MPEDFPRLRPNDPFRMSSRAYNALMGIAAGGTGGGDTSAAGKVPSGTVVRVENLSGNDVDQCGVLAISGPIFTPAAGADENDKALRTFRDEVLVSGTQPTSEDAGKFVVTLEPIAKGKIGRAYIDGACPVQVLVQDEDHKFADAGLLGGLTALQSAESGSARILWKQSGTGLKLAIVALQSGGGGSSTTSTAVRYIVTATNTTTPEIVEAIPYNPAGSDPLDVVNVRQVVGHGIGDELYAFKPVNGTDLPGIEWREAGPDGLDFPCNLEKVGGNGTLASPYTYHVKIGAFYLTASAVTALRSGAGGGGADAWSPVLGRAIAAAKYGRARFTGTTPAVELVEAFETRVPVIGVKLEAEGTLGGGGGTPSDTTYTVKDWDDTSITYGTGAAPPRMFGDDFKLTDVATYGWGFFNISGAFTLLAAADEKFQTTDCDS